MSPKGYTFGYEQQWVGIDVCQKYLDVYVRPLGNLFQVTNNEVGISKLVQTLLTLRFSMSNRIGAQPGIV